MLRKNVSLLKSVGRLEFRAALSVFLVAASFVVVGAPAFAASEADDLIKQGVQLRRSGDDQGALRAFERAYQIDPTPRAIAQMGLAEQALGRWVPANEHLYRALESTDDSWVKKSRSALNEALATVNEHVGRLEIIGGSPGAEVRINGAPQGTVPVKRPIVVATGSVTIDLVLPGAQPVQRITIVRAGQTIRESFDTAPRLAENPETSARGAGRSASLDQSASDDSPAKSDEAKKAREPSDADRSGNTDSDSHDSGLRPAAKWIAWGLGAVSAGVGIYGWSRQNKAGDDFSTGCGLNSGQVVVKPGANRSVGDCTLLRNQVDTNFRIEMIGLVGAGVLAATGLVLWLTEPSPATETATAWSCGGALGVSRRPDLVCQLQLRF